MVIRYAAQWWYLRFWLAVFRLRLIWDVFPSLPCLGSVAGSVAVDFILYICRFSRYIGSAIESCSVILFLGQVSCFCVVVLCSLISIVFVGLYVSSGICLGKSFICFGFPDTCVEAGFYASEAAVFKACCFSSLLGA